MTRKLLLLPVLLLLMMALITSAPAQEEGEGEDKDKDKAKEKVNLAWKFEKDKLFYQTMETTTKQTMKVMNHNVVQNQTQTFYFSWKPTKQDGDNWEIEQEILGVKMEIDIGNQKIKIDSAEKDQPNNPLNDFVKALVGQKFTLTLNTKDMKVTAITGHAAFLAELTKANPQMKPLLDQILSENALKEMAEPTFAAIPGKEVEVGGTWTKESKLDMGPIGTYENSYTYKLEGKPDDKGIVKIGVETTLKYKEPTEVAGNQPVLPFKIKSADLKTTNATGSITFNTGTGRIETSDMSLTLEGKLDIEIGGQTTKVELTQSQTSKVSTSDTNPVVKPE